MSSQRYSIGNFSSGKPHVAASPTFLINTPQYLSREDLQCEYTSIRNDDAFWSADCYQSPNYEYPISQDLLGVSNTAFAGPVGTDSTSAHAVNGVDDHRISHRDDHTVSGRPLVQANAVWSSSHANKEEENQASAEAVDNITHIISHTAHPWLAHASRPVADHHNNGMLSGLSDGDPQNQYGSYHTLSQAASYPCASSYQQDQPWSEVNTRLGPQQVTDLMEGCDTFGFTKGPFGHFPSSVDPLFQPAPYSARNCERDRLESRMLNDQSDGGAPQNTDPACGDADGMIFG